MFVLKRRETHLLTSLQTDRFTRFILFPLPAGSAYQLYTDEVRRRFPIGALTSVMVEGREYFSGAAGDLPVLFPNVTGPRGNCILAVTPPNEVVAFRIHLI